MPIFYVDVRLKKKTFGTKKRLKKTKLKSKFNSYTFFFFVPKDDFFFFKSDINIKDGHNVNLINLHYSSKVWGWYFFKYI